MVRGVFFAKAYCLVLKINKKNAKDEHSFFFSSGQNYCDWFSFPNMDPLLI
jgi:hypothetical protein